MIDQTLTSASASASTSNTLWASSTYQTLIRVSTTQKMASSLTDGHHKDVLDKILDTLQKLQSDHQQLSLKTDGISQRVDILALGSRDVHPGAGPASDAEIPDSVSSLVPGDNQAEQDSSRKGSAQLGRPAVASTPSRKSSITSRIILTTYPGQSGVDPLLMDWGHKDPSQRGPVVVSRHQKTVKRRNGQKSILLDIESSKLTNPFHSHRRPRRLVFHLPRSCGSQQRLRYRTPSRLLGYGACSENRTFSTVGRCQKDCFYGPSWPSGSLDI